MKFTSILPVLWTKQFEETILFYTGLLGFGVGERNDQWGWASLYKDDIEIMISKPNETPRFTNRFSRAAFISIQITSTQFGSFFKK